MNAHRNGVFLLARGEAFEAAARTLMRLADDRQPSVGQGAAVGAYQAAYGCTSELATIVVSDTQADVFRELARQIDRIRDLGTDDIVAAFAVAARERRTPGELPDLHAGLFQEFS